MISSYLARHRGHEVILLILKRGEWYVLQRHRAPTPASAARRSSEQNPGVLSSLLAEHPPQGPHPSLKEDREQVNRKGSGRTTFDLPLPSPVPVSVLHTLFHRPASWEAPCGSALAPHPLPSAQSWCSLPPSSAGLLLQGRLFWESAEFSTGAVEQALLSSAGSSEVASGLGQLYPMCTSPPTHTQDHCVQAHPP